MRSANLRLGLMCNNKCLFCTVAEENDKELTLEEIKNKIDYLIKEKVGHLSITGGEPTLREDLLDIIKYAKNKGIKSIELQTNASKLTNLKYILRLKKAELNSFLIALHSHREEISNYLTQSKNFKNSIKGIKNCVKAKLPVTISHVINSRNHKELIDFVKFIQGISKEIRFYFSFVRPNGRTRENKYLVPKLIDIELDVNKLLRYCARNHVLVNSVEGIPLCYLQNFENLCAEKIRMENEPQIYIDQNNNLNLNIHSNINKNLKRKSNNCLACFFNKKCPGVWREYAEIYGVGGLYPIFHKIENIGCLENNL